MKEVIKGSRRGAAPRGSTLMHPQISSCQTSSFKLQQMVRTHTNPCAIDLRRRTLWAYGV